MNGISVVVTTYDPKRYPDFIECIESLLNQSYSQVEILLVIEDESLYEKTKQRYSETTQVNCIYAKETSGLAQARNIGAEKATQPVIGFVDDDCIISEDWAEAILNAYNSADIYATAGPCIPVWPTESRPLRVPREMGWLVGATNPEFDTEGETRNAYGCNLTVKTEVFDELDGFDESLGKDHSKNLQGEDADLCARLCEKYETSVYFTEDASVQHKVYESQLSYQWLFTRAYLQGYTKAVFKEKGNTLSTEYGFLTYLFKTAIPNRLSSSITSHSISELVSIVYLLVYTLLVGVGYVFGEVVSNVYRKKTYD